MEQFLSRNTRLVPLLAISLVILSNLPLAAQTGSQTIGAPTIMGWGGSRLVENQNFTLSPAAASIVFRGQNASDQEVLARDIVAKGFNAIRVSFAPYCTNPDGFMSPYNSTSLHRAIRIAETLGIWIIVDYHGYNDTFNEPACWLNFWSGVTDEFKNEYSKIVWEPLNEPSFGPWVPSVCASENPCLAYLQNEYQQFIDQTRGQGDQHWIVVENICSFGCTYSDLSQGYTNVTDTLHKVFISIHPYMSYRVYHSSWNNSTAESLATDYYSAMLAGTARTGYPILDTEGGPGPTYAYLNGTNVDCPDLAMAGPSGYCRVNFHFIQTLTSLLVAHSPDMINWLWWPAGDWSSAVGDVLGAISPGGWGESIPSPHLPTSQLSLESGTGGAIFPSPGNYTFVTGTLVNITAFPSRGETFSTWKLAGGQLTSVNPLKLQVNTNQTITAFFMASSPTSTRPPSNFMQALFLAMIVGIPVTIVAAVLLRRRPKA